MCEIGVGLTSYGKNLAVSLYVFLLISVVVGNILKITDPKKKADFLPTEFDRMKSWSGPRKLDIISSAGRL